MSMLEIVTYPDNFLRRHAIPVKNIDGKIQEMIENMAFTMYKASGVGLAAIQVGCDKSIIVYDIAPAEEKRSLCALINPKIISSGENTISGSEGCLSVPDFRADVKRATSVLVEGFNGEGSPLRIEADGMLARVLQHEIDHLNGILFIDHISALKRELYKRRVKKEIKKKMKLRKK